MAKNTIELPSLLSFERKLETSDALMYSGNWSDIPVHFGEETRPKDEKEKKAPLWNPIKITPRFNRSTQSAHGIDDAKKTEPNPVSSGNDDAVLPQDKDTLKVSFTLRVIGGLGIPFACNKPDFEKKIKECVNQFKGNNGEGLKTLAYRYAYNIANGRFLWRNRVCAGDITVHVFINEEKTPLEFKPYKYSLKNFDENSTNENLQTLVSHFLTGLNHSEQDFVFFKVDAYVKLGNGQHIFPSEEMNMNEKGKKLFKLNECAAMHNVKIGNALRTIDDWYDTEVLIKTINDKGKDATDTVQIDVQDKLPIAIEPYGSVTQRGCAFRHKDEDLYSLMLHWVNDRNDQLTDESKNYVLGNLIRGGVFGGKSS
ncbi:MAG: type I-F CRISPR-associated protein Csy3 [Methylococcales bacterium]|nr:type I-F CRISPR-associated protein Csy3 [Methylococcales bacterium]